MAVKEKLTKDSGVSGEKEYDHIVEKLLAKPKAKGTIHQKKTKKTELSAFSRDYSVPKVHKVL